MVDRGHLKGFLLHPRESVRDFVSEYFSDARDAGEDLMPLVLEACERYGDEHNLLALCNAKRFALNEASLRDVLGRLANSADTNAIFNLNWIVRFAPVGLLTAMQNEVFGTLHLAPSTADRIRRRQKFAQRSGDDLWQALQQFSRKADAKKTDEPIDQSYANDLVEALAPWNVPDTQTLCDLLVALEPQEVWLEIFLADLAGARKLREAVPALVRKLGNESDYLVQSAGDALVDIGDPEALRLICQTYAQETWDFRLCAACVPGRIKRPESEVAILAMLATEEDVTIRTYLCSGLCDLFSPRCIEMGRKEFAAAYDSDAVSLEKEILDVSEILGITLPEAEQWRAQIEEDERKGKEAARHWNELFERLGEAPKRNGAARDSDEDDDEDDLWDEEVPEFDRQTGDPPARYQPAQTGMTEPADRTPYRRETPKIGRNNPCPCGSGKKYKKCCGSKG